jgi:hypothetical protein
MDAAVPNPFRFFVATSILHPDFLVTQSKVQKVSHNVPAVYDVFAAAIREREAFRQPQKCGWRLAWEWSAAE